MRARMGGQLLSKRRRHIYSLTTATGRIYLSQVECPAPRLPNQAGAERLVAPEEESASAQRTAKPPAAGHTVAGGDAPSQENI